MKVQEARLFQQKPFFRYEYATLTKRQDFVADFLYHFKNMDFLVENREFEIEYDRNRWYPLNFKLPNVIPLAKPNS